MAVGTSDVGFISKVIYDNRFDPKDLMGDEGLLGSIRQNDKFCTDEGYVIPIPTATGQGLSAQHSRAVANRSAFKGKRFFIPQTLYSASCEIEEQVMRNAIKGTNEARVIDQAKLQTDGAMIAMRNELARAVWASQTGARATVASVDGSKLILAHKSQTAFFAEDMVIVGANTPGTLLNNGGTVYRPTVVAVDPEEGSITLNGTVATVLNGATTNTILYRDGDAQESTTYFCMAGLTDWVPWTVTSTAFMGVDRTSNKVRLAGVRYDASSESPDIAFIKAMGVARSQVGQGLFKRGDVYIHPLNLAALAASKEGGKWITADGPYGLGIKKFSIDGFDFVEDYNCPINEAVMLAQGAFELLTSGDSIYWVSDENGNDLKYDPDTNTWKGTLHFIGNAGAIRPHNIMRIKLPTSMGA